MANSSLGPQRKPSWCSGAFPRLAMQSLILGSPVGDIYSLTHAQQNFLKPFLEQTQQEQTPEQVIS